MAIYSDSKTHNIFALEKMMEKEDVSLSFKTMAVGFRVKKCEVFTGEAHKSNNFAPTEVSETCQNLDRRKIVGRI